MGTKRLTFVSLCLASVSTLSSAKPCNTTTQEWPYEKDLGASAASVHLYAKMDLTRSCDSVKAVAQTGVDAKLFNLNDMKLFKATATANIDKREEVNLFGEVVLLGSVVDYFSHGYETSVSAQDHFSFPIDQSDSSMFMIGPVPVNINYGVQGEAQLAYQAELSIGEATVSLTPKVNAKVYADTNVDISIARVKADGDIVLVNDSMQQDFSLSVDASDLSTQFTAHGENQLAALSGRVGVEAHTNISGFERSYDKDIISWPGYESTNEIFDISKNLQL